MGILGQRTVKFAGTSRKARPAQPEARKRKCVWHEQVPATTLCSAVTLLSSSHDPNALCGRARFISARVRLYSSRADTSEASTHASRSLTAHGRTHTEASVLLARSLSARHERLPLEQYADSISSREMPGYSNYYPSTR